MRGIPSIPGLPRAKRLVNRLLGPRQPESAVLPAPLPNLHLSVTAPGAHLVRPLDPPLVRLHRRLRLHLFLYPVLILWFIANIFLIRQQYYLPDAPPIITCTATLWSDWPPDTCGVLGSDCSDALAGGPAVYRCLGGCKDVTLGNPRWIGGRRVNGLPLVIGGADANHTYRADSWVCASAIHAGLISPTMGGCVSLNPLAYPANGTSFPGSTSSGVQSIPFLASFPGAYTLSAPNTSSECLDLHPIISPFNALMLFLVTIFLAPQPCVLFAILLLLGYAQIVLLSDPPDVPPDWESILGGLLPIVFTGYWMYRVAFKRTLEGFRNLPLELGLWEGLGYWIGIESSTIFAKLPISRLGYGKLDGAGVTALVIILAVVVLVGVLQVWDMRKAGFLRYYLIRYLPLVPIMILLACIPGYTLRLHHYLYALLGIPVLSLPNRVSLFFQAFMLGLFLDGIGRWGWAGIIQETGGLRGDAAAGTPLPEFILANSTALIASTAGSIASNASTLVWEGLSQNLTNVGVTGWNVLVDDILRLENTSSTSVTMTDLFQSGWETGRHYFRLAYFANGTSLDFTDPVIRSVNGTWS